MALHKRPHTSPLPADSLWKKSVTTEGRLVLRIAEYYILSDDLQAP
jgi:hypothetical protein